MSSKNETEVNSIVLPSVAAGVFCLGVLLLQAVGAEAPPAEFHDKVSIPIVHDWAGIEPNDEFGHAVIGGLDLNGDGIQDFVIGAPGGKNGGYVRAFNGANGEDLWGKELRAPEGLLGFGSSLSFVPDHDADGLPDLLIGAPGEGAGAVVLVSGTKGRLIMSVSGKRKRENFGARVSYLDDINGDGIADFAVAAPGDEKRSTIGCVRIISGQDGSVIREITTSPRLGDRLGFSLAAPGDLDGDGSVDLVMGAIGENRAGYNAGAVFAYSPRRNKELYRVDGKLTRDELGHDLDACGDRTGDGVPDFYAAAFNREGEGYILLVDGKTGAIVKRYASGVANGLGHSVAACGDMDGDGVADFATGATREELFGHPNVGFVYIFSGATGDVLGTIKGDRGLAGFGYDLAGLHDMNKDGRAEVLIGSAIARDRVGRAVISHLPKKEN